MRFDISCHHYYIKIPVLPIPIIGNTTLKFNNNNITLLPNNTVDGYAEARELHLLNNQLQNLTVDQLPTNLTYLDLRNNRLEKLDEQVLEFLWNRSSSLSIKLSGNPWICDCNAKNLIEFVLKYPRIEDRDGIECSDPDIGQMLSIGYDICDPYANYVKTPVLPIPIIGNTTLKLNNNNITILPNNTVDGYAEARELHLLNNQLQNLTVDQLPTKLKYLDLRNNRLEKLDEQVLEFLWNRSSSLSIKLSGNPWICDCNAKNLIEFVLKYPKIEDRDGIECSDPDIGQMTSTLYKDIPELPIPITGNTSLNFEYSNLTKLPSRKLYGYSEVRELHLSNNQLSDIDIDQLPLNLTYLDLSNNNIEAFRQSMDMHM
ncbi:protein toll-like [Drosophila nasuta]|uniref:protein toll-like n=1 Tax=Drosophila nasuta TaxID=42062 RepID=UPI00295F0343|nr:protein toll-like [Drosophila nasuta]